jgi:hypothetical protein
MSDSQKNWFKYKIIFVHGFEVVPWTVALNSLHFLCWTGPVALIAFTFYARQEL